MLFQVIIPDKIKKIILKLSHENRKRIKEKLLCLEINPELGKHLSGLPYWSLRIGKYRIIYQIEKNKLLILVVSFGHRKGIY